MSSIYEQLNEACRQFGKNVGESLKEANYLIATSNKKERGIMADKVLYSEIMTRMHGDINYIAEEAYRDGYDHCEKEMKEKVNEAYQRGLDDAWECAKKIAQQWEEDTDTEHRLVIDDSIRVTLDSMTASEAIEKLKAYEEQEAADEIKVGVVVRLCRHIVPYIVTSCDGDDDTYILMTVNGGFIKAEKCNVRKTGRHFDIDKILEEMKE